MLRTNNPSLAISLLWKECFDYIYLNKDYYSNIFVHNLGSFDGYIIYKYLLKIIEYNKINALIDHQNKFISINLNLTTKIIIKDSYRIFPVSLQKLCQLFNIEGKLNNYNLEYNNINIFKNKELLENLKTYTIDDSISLLKAIHNARTIYLAKYNVDILNAVSAPSLSLLIYRHKFQDVNIPIFNRKIDSTIRDSYYGGSSDYYKLYGEDMQYHDVNSLYPYAMLNDMPLEYLGESKSKDLNEIFGFVECIITAPSNIKIPLLIHNFNSKIIHPTGT